MGPGIIAVNLEQVDLVGGRVVADVARGHPFHADRERQRHQGDDHPGPFPAIENEPADQPVERNDRDQIGQDDPQDEIRAGDRDARSLFEQVSRKLGKFRPVAPIGHAGLAVELVFGGVRVVARRPF